MVTKKDQILKIEELLLEGYSEEQYFDRGGAYLSYSYYCELKEAMEKYAKWYTKQVIDSILNTKEEL